MSLSGASVPDQRIVNGFNTLKVIDET